MATWEEDTSSTGHVLAFYCSTSACEEWSGGPRFHVKASSLWRREDHPDEM